MTNKEKMLFLSIFISVFGFSLFSAFNPLEKSISGPSLVVASEYISKAPISEDDITNLNFEEESSYEFDSDESKMVKMLSIALGISSDDVRESLDGGAKPSEMLASVGALLSDLEDEFNFRTVGDRGLVRFNS